MREPDQRWKVLGIVAVVAGAITVCVLAPGPERLHRLNLKPAETPKPTASPGSPPGHSKLPFELKNGKAAFGNPEAKVKITVYIPASEGCGNESAVFMYRVAKANSDRIALTVTDFKSAGGGKAQADAGTHCAGTTINGKQSVEIHDATGQPKTVDLHSNLGDKYQEKDIYLALDHFFQEAYGAPCQRAPETKPAGAAKSGPAPASTAKTGPPAAGSVGDHKG